MISIPMRMSANPTVPMSLNSDSPIPMNFSTAINQQVALSDEAKQALLDCFAHVAWIDENGQDYYDALYDALYSTPPATLVSISAVYTQSGTVYTTTSLDDLKTDLVVTATYDDASTETVTTYTLSGTLEVGTSTVTVSYGGKTTTFNVTVTAGLPSGYTRYDYIKNNANSVYLNTGLGGVYNDVTYEHEITFMITKSDSSTRVVYGLRSTTGSDPKSRALWHKTESTVSKIACNYGGTDTGYVYNITRSEKYTSVTKNGKWYMNGDLVQDHMDTGTYVYPTSGNITLFGISNSGNNGSGITADTRIYGFKVKNLSTNELVADMIPCKNSSAVAGFYDLVRQEFYSVSNITAGNDV